MIFTQYVTFTHCTIFLFAFFVLFVIFTHLNGNKPQHHKKMDINFATALQKELTADGRPRGEQAKAFGLNPSNLSQFASGQERCGPGQLDKILANVPKDAAARLMAAWLRDRISSLVEPSSIEIHVAGMIGEDPDALPQMDDELKAMVVYLARRATRHPEIRNALLSFGKALQY